MSKRGASSDLNKDNWDEKEEEEEAGQFTPLSESQLQNRLIRKARRSLGNSSSGTSPMGVSPFAKFSGFTPASDSSPFSSFKMDNNATALKSSFMAPKKETEKFNGNSEQEKMPQIMNSSDPVSKAAAATTCSGSSYQTKPSEKPQQIRGLEYYKQLQSLNESVLKWMQLHLAKNACSDFTPVFNDYKKHMDSLNVTYPVINKDAAATNTPEVFKKPESSTETTKPKDSNSFKCSVFDKKEKEETDYGNHFKSNTTNTSTFSFGIQSTPTATSTGSPVGPTSSSKEDKEANDKTELSQFSFGFFSNANKFTSDKTLTFASTPAENDEGQEYVPPKNEFVAVTEEGALYSKRCKLFFKKNDSYAEKGVGTLHLKKLDGKTQLLVRADTSLGNILLNIMLNESLPMSRTGKNNVLLVCIPNPPVDAKNPDSKEAIPILIRVKTAEDADELLETLNKHKS